MPNVMVHTRYGDFDFRIGDKVLDNGACVQFFLSRMGGRHFYYADYAPKRALIIARKNLTRISNNPSFMKQEYDGMVSYVYKGDEHESKES